MKLLKITFILAPKMWYLRINLIKYVQDLCAEKNKTLMKEIKKKLRKWGDIT